MAQVRNTHSFVPGAQFPTRKALYGARDLYHRTTGYKIVVQNCNKVQVIFVCHQHNVNPPKVRCPLRVRANSGKRSEVWTISPHSDFTHMCNVEDHPLPSKKAPAIAQDLASRIATEFANLPTGPALVKSFKSTEGTKPSLLEDVRTVGALVILLVTVKMEDHESLTQGEFIWTLRLGTLKFNLLLWLVVGCVSCSMLH